MTKTKTLLNRAIKAQQQMKENVKQLNVRMPYTSGMNFKVIYSRYGELLLQACLEPRSCASEYLEKKGAAYTASYFVGPLPEDIEEFLNGNSNYRLDYAINNMRAVD